MLMADRNPIRISQKEMLELYKYNDWWWVFSTFYQFCKFMQNSDTYYIYDFDKNKAKGANMRLY